MGSAGATYIRFLLQAVGLLGEPISHVQDLRDRPSLRLAAAPRSRGRNTVSAVQAQSGGFNDGSWEGSVSDALGETFRPIKGVDQH